MLNKQAWLIIYRVFAVGRVRQQIHIPERLGSSYIPHVSGEYTVIV